jgi:hypothetical protein
MTTIALTLSKGYNCTDNMHGRDSTDTFNGYNCTYTLHGRDSTDTFNGYDCTYTLHRKYCSETLKFYINMRMWNEHFVKIFSNMANMNVMNVADCYVANALATTYNFSVTFRDIGEVFNVELKSNIANIDVLKFKIEYMYAYKYGKSIKIRKKNLLRFLHRSSQ